MAPEAGCDAGAAGAIGGGFMAGGGGVVVVGAGGGAESVDGFLSQATSVAVLSASAAIRVSDRM